MNIQLQSASHQGHRRRAHCKVFVNDKDVTDRFDPYLISVRVIDRRSGMDTAHIELDDREAKLEVPGDGVKIRVELGWAGTGPRIPIYRHLQEVYDIIIKPGDEPPDGLPWEASGMQAVFNGTVDSVESGFSRRGGGRRMWIEAKSGDLKGKGKSVLQKSFGEGEDGKSSGMKMENIIQDAAKSIGMTAQIDKSLGAMSRHFVYQNESTFNFIQRLAKEMGGHMKIVGNNITVSSATSGLNVAGQNLPTVEAVWGLNLISWRIKPFTGRPQYKDASVRYFDIFEGAFKSVTDSIGGSGVFGKSKATAGTPLMAPNAQVGTQYNGGAEAESENKRGRGWCIINGEPSAAAGNKLVIIGARPGVDGGYTMEEVEHNYTRAGGYTTRINVENPNFKSETRQKPSVTTPSSTPFGASQPENI